MARTECTELSRLRDQSAWLRELARRLVGTSAAEDLAQDTMVRALEAPPADDRPVRPWLVRVLRNTARMRARAEQRRTRRETAASDAESVVRDPSIQMLETHRTLCELVLALDEPLRRTIVARYVEGISLAELARRDGVVEATLRWRHARALVLLREALDQRAGGDRSAWMLALAPMGKLPASTTVAWVGGAIVNKLVMAGLFALIAGVGSLWWWRTSRAADAPPPAAGPAPATAALASAAPASAPRAQSDAGAPDRTPHVTRMTDARTQRRQLAERIAAARARRAPQAAPTGSAAGSAGSAMDSPEHVLAQMMASLQEVRGYVTGCVDRAGTGMRGFHAGLTLTGDADVGTLIESSELSSLDGQPLPAPLDDCVRDVLQSLALPPMALDDAFKVTYEFTFDDEAP